MTITRTPASASRASVPPHASDSSSGCAKTARTGRLLLATMCIHDPAVDADIFIDHAVGPEARHRMLPHSTPIEREHPRQRGHHLVEVLDDEAGDAVVDHLAHS